MDSLGLDEPLLLPSAENKRLENVFNINAALKDGLLELFPNPAKEHVTISYRVDIAFKKGEIRILNQLGQQLYSKAVRNEIDQVVIRHGLDQGYYLLELRIDDLSYKTSSLIVK